MATKINESFPYQGTTVEQVYALITDAGFREEASVAQHALDQKVTVEDNGEGDTVKVERTMPAELPDFIKKITGDTVKVRQTEAWTGPDADGNRTAQATVEILGQPASFKGTSHLRGTADGTELTLEGEVKVNLPIIGRKIEPEIAKAIIKALNSEVALGIEKLDG